MKIFEILGQLCLDIGEWIGNLFKAKSVVLPALEIKSPAQDIKSVNLETFMLNVKQAAEIGTVMVEPPKEVEEKPYTIPNAQEMKIKAEENRRLKIDKQLKRTLNEIMIGVDKQTSRGQTEAVFDCSLDPQVMSEAKVILEAKGYKVLRNSMSLEWVVRWT